MELKEKMYTIEKNILEVKQSMYTEIVHSSHSTKVLEKTYIDIMHSFFNSTKILEMLGLLHTLYKCPYIKSKYVFTWK